MSETQHAVFRHLREGQDKYTYFMLTAAGAAIALAVKPDARGCAEVVPDAPWGRAVLCWGLSFFCGARHLAYVNSTLYANLGLLRVEAGREPMAGQHPEMIQAASDGIRSTIEANSEKPADTVLRSSGFWWPGPYCTWCGAFWKCGYELPGCDTGTKTRLCGLVQNNRRVAKATRDSLSVHEHLNLRGHRRGTKNYVATV